MLTLNDGRSELWQWDTGRKLTVDADCSQVHFSNKVFGRSIDVDVVSGLAIIPDILLQTDKDLNVWAFVGTAENGYTKISKSFKVNRRNKPADYVFTPPEQTTLAGLVARLDAIEESQDPDAIKNAVEDYMEQNPVEAPVESVNGKTGEVNLTAEDVGAISKNDLQEATNESLAQAKASGEFDGTSVTVKSVTESTADGGSNVVTFSDGKTLTVKNGKTGAAGKDGADGQPGKDGADGAKGDKGDKGDRGLQGAQGIQGERGEQGQKGEKGEKGDPGTNGKDGADGQPGKDGADGFSPVVDVENIDGGHRVTITDKDGDKTFDVMDGKDGQGGGVSVQSDWNQTDETAADFIKNKPFGVAYGDTLTWTAITEADFDESNLVTGALYPVSDAIVTLDDCAQGGSISIPAYEIEASFTVEECFELAPGLLMIGEMIFCTAEDNGVFEVDGDTWVIPKAGVYAPASFLFANGSFTLNGFGGFVRVITLDEKYIPNTIVRKSNLVQPDWEQTDETALNYIKNKPKGLYYIDYRWISEGSFWLLSQNGEIMTKSELRDIVGEYGVGGIRLGTGSKLNEILPVSVDVSHYAYGLVMFVRLNGGAFQFCGCYTAEYTG